LRKTNRSFRIAPGQESDEKSATQTLGFPSRCHERQARKPHSSALDLLRQPSAITIVIPAKAGIQIFNRHVPKELRVDSRLRGNDGEIFSVCHSNVAATQSVLKAQIPP